MARIFFVDFGISTNDTLCFIILPMLAFIFMLTVSLADAKMLFGLPPAHIPLLRRTRSEFVWLFLLTLLTILSGIAVTLFVRYAGLPSSSAILHFDKSLSFAVWYTFVIVLLGPVAEEFFWRGFVQSRLSSVIGAPRAFFAQALAFALMHFRPIGGFLPVLTYGLIFGLWRWKRKTLLPVIIAHIAVNAIFCIARWDDRTELMQVRPTTDYVAQYERLVIPTDLDPNDNARRDYEAAFALAVPMPKAVTNQDIKVSPEELSPQKQLLLKQWIQDSNDALIALERGAAKPFYWPDYSGTSMFSVGIPELGPARILTYALGARARMAAANGRFDNAFAELSTGLRFANHFTGRKTAVE
jgi:membrane protease YdiL (CAAX protease family)